MKKRVIFISFILIAMVSINGWSASNSRPNILIALSDDQSYPHASAYGESFIKTPSLDRVARAGVLFNNAFTPAPGCSPMRAAFLTGRHIWQIEHAGTHASSFSKKYETFQQRLQDAGYFVGFTGKGWAPGDWKISGRLMNPAGPEYASERSPAPAGGIKDVDYAANFEKFLQQRPKGKPFSFWYGGFEPHRSFEKGIGKKKGMDASKVKVPPFLPDTAEIRDDLLDYGFEIQWFDRHLGLMLDALEKTGELDNTIVIVTSDNGMAFPRAKANVYEYGIHMPLAISWPKQIPAGRAVDDLVDLIDVTATIYDATGTQAPAKMPLSGHSLLTLLKSDNQGKVEKSRDAVYCGRERHSSSRYRSLGYPQRCIRTEDYLYIRNFRSERWPAGAPRTLAVSESGEYVSDSTLAANHSGYHDIDSAPSLTYMIENRNNPLVKPFFELAVAKRPADELYDIQKDPGCLHNLAVDPAYLTTKERLENRLLTYLEKTQDSRVTAKDGGDNWENYPRYKGGIRQFPKPEWVLDDTTVLPQQDWLDEN
jgi:N-sulfoglucosamine sulfohydrolase